MVDFSKREDIKHWLDGLEPEERRREVAIALAARAALRNIPLLLSDWQDERDRLPSLRAGALSWVAARYPAHSAQLRASGYAARAAAARGLSATIRAVEAVDADAPAACVYAAAAALEVPYAYRVHQSRRHADDALADAALIESGRSGAELAGLPLWRDGAPDWASEDWRTFKAALLAANQDWDVWTDWYEARLAGDAAQLPNEALEIARATIPDEIWRQGPAVVNAEIKRLIGAHESGALDADGRGDVDESNAAITAVGDPTPIPSHYAVIFGTRAALRVLPRLAAEFKVRDSSKSGFVLSVFRALAATWATSQHSASVDSKQSIAAARDVPTSTATPGSAAHFVGSAAAELAFAAGSTNPRVVASRTSVALTRVTAAILARPDEEAAAVLEEANLLDKKDISSGVSVEQFAQIELWPGRYPPPTISDQWNSLKNSLRSANEGWDVWIDWYEARLDGRVRSQEVELAYVNFALKASPKDVLASNSEIRRLIEAATVVPHPAVVRWDYFVSYATEDEAIAREVVSVLEDAGHSTLAQFKDFPVGANFVHEMNRGLTGAGRVAVLYSPSYQSSEHCQAEWDAAYNSDPSGAKRKLVPFMLAPTALDPLARQIVYKSLVGLNSAQRKAAILEAITPSPRRRSADEIKSRLAEVASPQASINAKRQLDAGPNVVFDRPFVDADLPELPSNQRGLANTIRKSLPRNAPPVVGSVLESYAEHLLERGAQPIVRYLDDLAAALRAELEAPEGVEWVDKGVAKLFERFFANDGLLRTHFPLAGEEIFADMPINEDEATGGALSEPIKNVAAAMQDVADAEKATSEIVKAVRNSAAFANDLASLPPSQTPLDPNSTRVTVKRRYVLGTIGFLVTIYNLVGTTASIYGIPQGAALLQAVEKAIEQLMSLVL